MILGLLKPSFGKILINGNNIENKRVDLLNQLNFISPYIELPKKLTVKQNLEVYGRLYDIKDLGKKIEYLSEKLKLKNILNKITGELSSGQKNRVSLAKSIINDPKVLLWTNLPPHLILKLAIMQKFSRRLSKQKNIHSFNFT